MNYNLTTKDIAVLGQKTKSYFIKIELLNNHLQLLDVIEGNCLSCNLDIDSTADIRRTVSLSMIVKNPKDLVSPTSKIWINRYLKIYLGIQYIRTKEILWYPLILCVPSEDTYTYDISNRTLEVKCVDFIDTLINTPLYGTITHTIPAGSNIRSVLISALKLANVKKYNICEISSIMDSSANTVPYDISMDSSSSVYDLIKKLLELYAGYEIFADLDIITVQRVPTTIEDGIVLSDDILKSKGLIISESVSNSLNVKNVTEVFGKQIEADYYSESVTLSGNQYNATIDGLTGLVDGMQIALKLPSANPANAKIKINSLTAYSITDTADVVLSANTINGYNVFRFHNNCFEYLGQYQIHGICMLVSNEPTNDAKTYYQQYFNCDNIFYRVSPNNEFTIEKLSTSLYEQKYLSGQNITLFRTLSDGKIDSLFITGRTNQAVTVQGKNLLNGDLSYWESGGYDLSTGNKDVRGGAIRLKYLISVKPSTAYYFKTFVSNYVIVVRQYTDKGNYINLSTIIANDSAITTDATAYYLGIFIIKQPDDSSTTYDQYATMLSDGTLKPFICLNSEVDKSYTPFVPNSPSPDYPAPISGTTALTVSDGGNQSQTIALPQTLYSLPDGTADSYDVVSGNGTQKISKKVLNSAPQWHYKSSGYYSIAFTGVGGKPFGAIISSHFTGGRGNNEISLDQNGAIYFSSLMNTLTGVSDSDDDATALSKIGAWFAANPVTVLYELATPKAISGEAQDILPYQDYTNISNDANAIMDVTYSEYPASFNYWIDGCRIDTKSGNDYDSIYSQELAIERCKFENWKSSRLNRTLSLTTQIIPFLDVNQKFTYRSKIDNVLRTWIITKISYDNVVSGQMNLEATEFFETYPETYE